MRRDPGLRDLVHLPGADLHLERLGLRTDDRGVQRLVHVRLGHGDVVVELPGHRAPQRVHDAEGGVAVLHVVHEHADGVEVVDLGELGALALHLLGDRVEVLRPPADLGVDRDLCELLAQDADGLVDEALARSSPVRQRLDQLAVLLGLEVLEGEVLELPLDLPHAQPMRQRRVDLHRLARDALLLLRRQVLERLHVVEPVGELDDHDPHVLGHGHEHLPDVLGLLLLHRPGAPELGQLRHAVHEAGDVPAEALLDLGDGVVGVLGNVVEQRRGQRLGVHLERGEVVGHRDRMGDVLLARAAELALVRGDGRVVGAADQGGVDVRPVAGGLRDDLVDGVIRAPAASPPRVIRCTTAAGEKRASCAMGA